MKAVQLHTTGRKSGQRRTVWLTSPDQRARQRIVLIASKGGDDRHPDWYHNVVAHPDVEITDGDVTTRVDGRARRPRRRRRSCGRDIVAAYKGYAGYQKRTERDIPVVICEPR